jgi:tetratricopeptide (TPR) repeat protein
MNIPTRLVLAALLLFSYPLLAAQAPSGATARPKTAPKPEDVKKAVENLIAEGEGALAAGDFKAARDSFSDALTLSNKKNANAHHGLGLAYIGLNQPQKAAEALEAAINLGNPDRSLLINHAVAQSACGRPMRGIIFIERYLKTVPLNQAPDEPLLNTLKIMLESIPPEQRITEYNRIQTFYEKLNKQLEDKVGNGQKRWGLKWVPAEEAIENEKKRKAAEQEMLKKQQEIVKLERELQQANDHLEFEKTRRLEGSTVLLRAQAAFDLAKQRYDDAVTEYQKVAADVPQPDYPKLLSTVPMGDKAGSENDPTKVAVATTTDTQPEPAPIPEPPPSVRNTTPNARTNSRVSPTMTTAPRVQFGGSRKEVAKQIIRNSAGFLVGADLLVTSAASVKDATSIEVISRDGQSCKAELVRAEGTLALLKVDLKGAARPALPLSDADSKGPLQCLAFASPASIFDDEGAEVIEGVMITPTGDARMKKHPRLPGAPLMTGGKVVAVELAERESPITAVPIASLEKLKALLGTDATATTPARDPLDALYQVKSAAR